MCPDLDSIVEPERPVDVLIVDSHEASRVGLAVLLGRLPWIDRCLIAVDAPEGRALARRHRPAAAILDISDVWPFVETAVAGLRAGHPGIEIVLSSRSSLQLRATLRELGAAAYLAAPNSGEQLAAAVRDALLAPDSRAATPARPDRSELTPRERELLLLISTGATNREIAAQLHLGPDAIKKNASALYRKLGVRNRIEAAKLASMLHAFPRS